MRKFNTHFLTLTPFTRRFTYFSQRVSPAFYLRFTCVLPAFYLRFTCVLPAFYTRFTRVLHAFYTRLHAFYTRFTRVLHAFQLHLYRHLAAQNEERLFQRLETLALRCIFICSSEWTSSQATRGMRVVWVWAWVWSFEATCDPIGQPYLGTGMATGGRPGHSHTVPQVA